MRSESKALPSDVVGWAYDVLMADGRATEPDDGAPSMCHRAIPPRGADPRWLIPSRPRRAARRATSAYWRLRNPRQGWAFMMLGAGIGVLGTRLLPGEVRAGGPATAGLDDPQASLLAHLGEVLDEPALLASVDIPWAGHRTPKLRMLLLRPSGEVVGYAKVGWNEHTRRMVAREAEALAELDRSAPTTISVPRVLHTGTWNERNVLVTEPLPSAIRRLRRGDLDPLELARQIPHFGPITFGPVGESPYWQRTIRDLHDLTETASPQASKVIEPAIELSETVADRYGDVQLQWGRWHGDWVDRNMGIAGGRAWVWDWERSDAEVPFGFDVLQREVQISRDSSGLDLGARRLDAWLEMPARTDAEVMATVGLHRLDLLRREAIWTDRTLPSRRFDPVRVATLPTRSDDQAGLGPTAGP